MSSTLSIDIETYCELDLRQVGVYKYVEHPSFEILLIAYCLDDDILGPGDIELLDLTKDDTDINEFRHMLTSCITKTAFNANFERTCLAKYFGDMPPEQWDCTMVRALRLGLPGSLDKLGSVLRLKNLKMREGKALINYFCKPCKPTKTNGGRTRNLPEHATLKWDLFKDYCKQDVRTEMSARNKIIGFDTTDTETLLWQVDQRINDRGVQVDTDLVHNACVMDDDNRYNLMRRASEITGLDNPNSAAKLKDWISQESGLDVASMGLNKDTLPDIKDATKHIPSVSEILDIRSKLAKTSNSKYHKMQDTICDDGRIKGLLQFYGAARTGRWAGRLVQIQNLPQNKIPDLKTARDCVLAGDSEIINMLYGDTPKILSQLIRTAFVPRADNVFYIADLSAIEARITAWLAGEDWRMQVFNTHGMIYEASAAEMFKVDINTIIKGHPNYALRAKGKIAELALGFGGSVGAISTMQANMSDQIPGDEIRPLVNSWRAANPSIVSMWWAIGDAAMEAVSTPGRVVSSYGMAFEVKQGILFITLLSGRKLAYVRPRIVRGKYNRPQIQYEGQDQTSRKWCKIDIYGPKFVENIVQATARDILAHALIGLDRDGFRVVMHVHDEVIVEAPKSMILNHKSYDQDGILNMIEQYMRIGPDWAKGLPLDAAGFYCDFYKKD